MLTRILTNPRYAGLRAYNGVVFADGTWEPVFDRSTWEWLSLALESRPASGNRRFGARTYALVGFLFCSKCGAKLRSLQKQNGKRASRAAKAPDSVAAGRSSPWPTRWRTRSAST